MDEEKLTTYSGNIKISDFINRLCATHRVNPKDNWCKAPDVDELINKLKCCANCKHALIMSQMGLYNTRPCKDCINESLWEMEDYK